MQNNMDNGSTLRQRQGAHVVQGTPVSGMHGKPTVLRLKNGEQMEMFCKFPELVAPEYHHNMQGEGRAAALQGERAGLLATGAEAGAVSGVTYEEPDDRIDGVRIGGKCTDVMWAMIFIPCLIFLIVLGVMGMMWISEKLDGEELAKLGGWFSQEDFAHIFYAIGLAAVYAIGGAAGLTALFRYCPYTMVWIGIASQLVVPLGFLALLYIKCGWMLETELGMNVLLAPTLVLGTLSLWGLIYLILCCTSWYSHVKFAAQVLKTTSIVIRQNCCMLTIGFLSCALQLVVFVVYVCAVIYSIYKIVEADPSGDNIHGKIFGTIFGLMFLYFWASGVVCRLAYVTYCKVFGYWYFCGGIKGDQRSGEADRDDTKHYGHAFGLGGLGVGTAFASACTLHFGSICLGSFVIAIVQVLQQIAKQAEQDRSPVVRILGAIVHCLLVIIEDIIEFLNDICYVHVAVYNSSYCEGARSTMQLITQQGLRTVVSANMINGIIGLWIFIFVLISMTAGTIITHIFLNSMAVPGNQEAAAMWYLKTFIFVVINWLLTWSFVSSIGQIIRAGLMSIVVCYAEHPQALADSHPVGYHYPNPLRYHAIFLTLISLC